MTPFFLSENPKCRVLFFIVYSVDNVDNTLPVWYTRWDEKERKIGDESSLR